MVWLSQLVHRLLAWAGDAFRARRTPSSECTPVSILSVSDEDPDHPTSDISSPPSAAPSDPPSDPSPPSTARLLALPDDILLDIVRRVTHAHHDAPSASTLVVDHHSFARSLPLTLVSHRLNQYFYRSLDNLVLSSPAVDDHVVARIARNSAAVLNRIVLRACHSLTDRALYHLADNAQALRSIDISFVREFTDDALVALCRSTAPKLRKLLLRKCASITDRSLHAIATCRSLEILDISYCTRVTDNGLEAVALGCGNALRLLATSHNPLLTDRSLCAIGRNCINLTQLCARGLEHVTDLGFHDLCAGLGSHIEGIDVTDCHQLSRDATLTSLNAHCPKIYAHVIPSFANKALRQILISTLRQNIFIVHGSDPSSGRQTVHTVLIDNGDIVSASLLSSGTTDLSLLGIVLCKSYGAGLDDSTKKMLEDDYGIPQISLED